MSTIRRIAELRLPDLCAGARDPQMIAIGGSTTEARRARFFITLTMPSSYSRTSEHSSATIGKNKALPASFGAEHAIHRPMRRGINARYQSLFVTAAGEYVKMIRATDAKEVGVGEPR
jgi:hypothetical protein